MMWVHAMVLLGCAPPEPRPDPTPEPPTTPTASTSDTSTPSVPIGETGSVNFDLTFDPPLAWSVPADPLWPQHHAKVAWTAQRQLLIAWTLREVYLDPVNFLRIVSRNGESRGVIQLAQGFEAAKPDVALTGEGHALVAMESDALGIWVDVISLPELVSIGTRQIAPASQALGNNSVDVAVRADDTVDIAWYSGEADQGGTYFLGGLSPGLGAVSTPFEVATIDHVGPSPPDVGGLENGNVGVAWTDIDGGTPGADGLGVSLSILDPTTGVWSTVRVADVALGPTPIVPRPALATNPAGRMATAWQTESQAGVVQIEFVALEANGTLIESPLAPVGPVSERPDIAFAGSDLIVMAYERREETPSVWVTVLAFPSAEIRVQPMQVSDPGVRAARPSLAVREVAPGSWDVGLSWEQVGGNTRGLWGRMGSLTRD